MTPLVVREARSSRSVRRPENSILLQQIVNGRLLFSI